MPLPVVARGALIGGGVGVALALLRRPQEGEHDPSTVGRVVKSAAEGAMAGAVVGLVLDRTWRRRAAELVAANAPLVLDAVGELAERYEPVVERLAEVALERAVEAYESARPRVEDAVVAARGRFSELRAG